MFRVYDANEDGEGSCLLCLQMHVLTMFCVHRLVNLEAVLLCDDDDDDGEGSFCCVVQWLCT